MKKERAIVIGGVFGVVAAVVQGWLLWRWLGASFWFLALVVPLCLVTMQVVGGTIAAFIIGDPPPRPPQ